MLLNPRLKEIGRDMRDKQNVLVEVPERIMINGRRIPYESGFVIDVENNNMFVLVHHLRGRALYGKSQGFITFDIHKWKERVKLWMRWNTFSIYDVSKSEHTHRGKMKLFRSVKIDDNDDRLFYFIIQDFRRIEKQYIMAV